MNGIWSSLIFRRIVLSFAYRFEMISLLFASKLISWFPLVFRANTRIMSFCKTLSKAFKSWKKTSNSQIQCAYGAKEVKRLSFQAEKCEMSMRKKVSRFCLQGLRTKAIDSISYWVTVSELKIKTLINVPNVIAWQLHLTPRKFWCNQSHRVNSNSFTFLTTWKTVISTRRPK